MLVAMKQTSDLSHAVAPNSTIQSIDLAKSKTSLSLLSDDMEQPGQRNKIVMDSFNGVAKTTIGRGKEEKLAGQLLTFNIKEGERIPEKIDEGRLLLQLYNKQMRTLSADDAYEEKTALKLAMAETGSPRDFLARLGCRFQQMPGIRGGKSEFQRCHKRALLHLAQVRPTYDNRKLECYCLPLAMYFLIEEMVAEEEDETAKRLLVEAFKDTEGVIQALIIEMDKVDELMASMGSSRARLASAPLTAGVPVQVAETVDEVFENLGHLVDSFEGTNFVETTKFIKIHKKKHGHRKHYISFAHQRISNRHGGKDWKTGWGLPEFHPVLNTTVAWFTDLRSRTRHTGSDYTSSAGCKQVLFEIMPSELKEKIASLLDVTQGELEDAAPVEEDEDIQGSQSQAFPAFSQSQGSDTVRVCRQKDCGYQTQSSGEMDMHTECHPRCVHCGKQFLTDETLKEHMVEHATFTCDICQKDIECQHQASHMESHHRQDLFKQTLENGRVGRKPIKPSTPSSAPKVSTGYPVFLKINYSKIKAKNPHLSYKEVRSLVSVEWRALGKVEKQAYKTMGGSTEEEALLGHQQVQQQLLLQQVEQLQGQVQAQSQRLQGGGHVGQIYTSTSVNRFTPASDQGRITRCHICGKLHGGVQELNNHIAAEVIVIASSQ